VKLKLRRESVDGDGILRGNLEAVVGNPAKTVRVERVVEQTVPEDVNRQRRKRTRKRSTERRREDGGRTSGASAGIAIEVLWEWQS
jgi:hypothetical protein